MRLLRRTMILLAAGSMVAVASPALAGHDDPIPEKIPVSDAEFELELVADGLTTPVLGINSPGNNKQLFVVDQVGTVTVVKLEPLRHGGVPDSFTILGRCARRLLRPRAVAMMRQPFRRGSLRRSECPDGAQCEGP